MIEGLFIVLIFSVLFIVFRMKPKTNKTKIKTNKPPQPKDFDNYYVYKSKLAEYNESQYEEFIEKCKKGECTFIEKEIISHEREKSNEIINNLKQKL